MAEMKGLEFEIRGNADKAVKSIERLKKSLGSLKGVSNSANFNKFASSVSKLGSAIDKMKPDSLKKLSQAAGELGQSASGIREFADAMREAASIDYTNLNQAAEALLKISDALKNVGTQTKKKFSLKDLFSTERLTDESSGVKYFLDSLRIGFVGIEQTAKKVASSIGSVFKRVFNFILSIPRRIKDAFVNLWGSVKKFYNTSIFTKPIRDFTESIKTAISKLNGLGRAIKRIVFYRFIRSLVKEVTQGVKEGINNLYAWSQVVDGRFAASMDRLATAFAYFKNSIGAMTAPLINAIAPAIDYVIDKAVDLLNVINQLFARLTGATYWTRAVKQATAYGDAASAAGSAAKEAIRYLAPFDELNVLPSDSGSGGGNGSGSSGSGMFEIVEQFESGVNEFAQKVKDAFETGEWKDLGVHIGNKINELFEKISWSEIGTKVGKFMTGLLSTQYWTFNTIDFQNAGAKISEFLNGILEEMLKKDANTGYSAFETWGRSLTQKVTNGIDFAFGLLGNIDAHGVGTAVHDFLTGVFNQWAGWFDGKDWKDVKENFVSQVKKFFSGLNFADIATSFVNLGSAIFNAIKEGFPVASTWVETNIISPVKSAINGETTWKEAGSQMWQSITKGIPGLLKWAKDNIVDPIATALIGEENWSSVQSFFSDPAGVFHDLGVSLGASIAEGVDSYFTEHPINILALLFGKRDTQTLEEYNQSVIDGTTSATPTSTGYITWTEDGGYKFTSVYDMEITPTVSESAGPSFWSTLASILSNSTPLGANWGVGAGFGVGIDTTANYTDWQVKGGKSSAIIDKWTTWKSTANYESYQVHGSTSQSIQDKWTTWKSTANYEDYQVHGSKSSSVIDKWTSWKSTADYVDYKVNGSKSLSEQKKFTTWSSTANYTGFEVYGSKSDAERKKFTTWSSTANYTGYEVNGSKSDAERKKFTTWSSTANYTGRTDSLTTKQKTFDTGADFKKTYDSLPTDKWGVKTWFDVGAEFKKSYDSLTAAQKTISVTAAFTNTNQTKAKGGIFSGGVWRNIPQYAGGTSNAHGSLFLAGEAGPEVVGHVGGRTEVLNQSQLAAAVSAGVARAINSAHFQMTGISSAPMPTQNEDDQTEDAMYRAMVRALNEVGINVDVEMDGEKVYQSVARRNLQNTRATGVNRLAMA